MHRVSRPIRYVNDPYSSGLLAFVSPDWLRRPLIGKFGSVRTTAAIERPSVFARGPQRKTLCGSITVKPLDRVIRTEIGRNFMVREGYLLSLYTTRCAASVKRNDMYKSGWKIIKQHPNLRPHPAFARNKDRLRHKSFPLTKHYKHVMSLRRPGRTPP